MSLAYERYEHTLSEIEEALTYIPADCSRGDWVNMAFAIKSYFGEAGFDIWDKWSRSAPEVYSPRDAKDVWRSAKQYGKIQIGTLIGMAKANGWQYGHRREFTAEEMAARQAERQAAQKRQDDAERQARAAAAKRALEMWEAAEPINGDDFPYLARKQVMAYGVRLGAFHSAGRKTDGAMLVPLVNGKGKMTSIQAYFPNENPEIGRDRDYLKDGQKKGSFHMIGRKPAGEKPVIVVCEGYATGASIYMATGYTTFVAFDVGNLKTVAAELRKEHPTSTIVIAADNDQWGDKNPGKLGADAAARACFGHVVLPEFSSADGKPKDFNDLHVREGLAAVKAQIESVIPAGDEGFLSLDATVNPWGFPERTARQAIMGSRQNMEWLMGQYGITARYNEISKNVEVLIPGKSYLEDDDDNSALSEVRNLCVRNEMPKNDAKEWVSLIAKASKYNPVRDFVLAREWDGVSRFNDLLDTIQAEPGFNRDFMALLMRRWLVSAVAAAFEPKGFWCKGILVFQGGQSLGKTSWFRRLLPTEQHQLLKVGVELDLKNKDTIIKAISHWLVELGELDATFRKSDLAALKGFISQDSDMLRRPYDALDSKYPRRTVFFASVNPREFLADDTGNVRFWTIPTVGLNYQHDIDMQQLWAEVYAWYRDGEQWWLDKHEENILEAYNKNHAVNDQMEDQILTCFDWENPNKEVWKEMTTAQVLTELGYRVESHRKFAKRCGVVLASLSGEQRKTKAGRFYLVPPRRLPAAVGHRYADENQPF